MMNNGTSFLPKFASKNTRCNRVKKKMQQKVLARSRQHFQTASVELTSFSLDCFGISGTCVFENAGPDSTFVFSVSFDVPPPEGLLLQGEFRSNFQDQVHIRHSDSGAIMATLIVKAIWDLTPDHIAVFFPPVLSSPVASASCQLHSVDTVVLQQGIAASKPTQHSATTDHVELLRRPKYDDSEDLFYRSLLAGEAAEARIDKSASASISAPKDSRVKLSADDTAFYSTVIASGQAAPVCGEVNKPKPTKAVVNFEGDDIIIIEGIKYDTWGNLISDTTESKHIFQDVVERQPVRDALDVRKKLPHLGPTVIRGSNVLALAPQADHGGRHDGNRYLEILNGNLVPETQEASLAHDSNCKRSGNKVGGTGTQGSSKPSHGVIGTKVAVSSLLSGHQKQASSAQKIQVKKGLVKSATISALKTDDDFNDAWDAL
jgi:hypothetical protein